MMEPSHSTIDWSAQLEYHKPWLAKVLRCRIGDRHEVDDLLQEIALAVFRQHPDATEDMGIGLPNDPSKVAPWLYRLAVRQAVNFHRRSNRKTQAKPVADLETTSAALQPLDWLLAEEQSQHLKQAIGQLRPQDREILTLKFTENWSYQQLADHLGIPVRSVEYRLLQARKHLRNFVVNGVTATTNPVSAMYGNK